MCKIILYYNYKLSQQEIAALPYHKYTSYENLTLRTTRLNVTSHVE